MLAMIKHSHLLGGSRGKLNIRLLIQYTWLPLHVYYFRCHILCTQVERPDTPTLQAIQAAAGRSLAKVVERYLVESGEINDSVGSLMSDENRQRVSLTNHKVRA